MDPLSISASVITLITALQAGVNIAHNVLNAPRELSDLIDELAILSELVKSLNALPKQRLEIGRLSGCLFETRSCLEELDSLIYYRLLNAEQTRVNRWQWVKYKPRVTMLKTTLRVKRESLIVAVILLTSSVLSSTSQKAFSLG